MNHFRLFWYNKYFDMNFENVISFILCFVQKFRHNREDNNIQCHLGHRNK